MTGDGGFGVSARRFSDALFWVMSERQVREAAARGLTLTQAHVLTWLEAGSRSTGEMAAALGISPPAVTQLCDRLIRKGLVARLARSMDRRVVLIELSETGRAITAQLAARRGAILEDAMLTLEETARNHALLAIELLTLELQTDTAPPAKARETSAPPARRVVPTRGTTNKNRKARARPEERTAPEAAAASKDSAQWKTGNASRKVRIEWD